MYLVGRFLLLAGLGCLDVNRMKSSSTFLNVRKGTKIFPVGQAWEVGGSYPAFVWVLGTYFLHFNGFSGVFY